MLRDLKLEVFYPHPPERVWQVITNRRILAEWLMENDFEARLGHKFQFKHSTLPGLEGNIDCEVIALEEPQRLSLTWQDSMMGQPSIVTFTLQPVDGGTQLQLEHTGFIAAMRQTQPLRIPQPQLGYRQPTAIAQTVAPTNYAILPSLTLPNVELGSVILESYLHGGWEYKLKARLSAILESIGVDTCEG